MPKIIPPTLFEAAFSYAADQEAIDRPRWLQYRPQRFANGSGYLHEPLFNEINQIIKDGGGKQFDWKNQDLGNQFVIGDDSREDKLFSHYYNAIDKIAEQNINYRGLTDFHKNKIVEEEAKYVAGLQKYVEDSVPDNIGKEGKDQIYEQLNSYMQKRLFPAIEGTIDSYSAREANEMAGDNWRRAFRTSVSSIIKQVGNMSISVGDDYKEGAKQIDDAEFRDYMMNKAEEYDKKTEEELAPSAGIYNLPLAEAKRQYDTGLMGLAWKKPDYLFNKAGEYVIQSAISSGIPRAVAMLLSFGPSKGWYQGLKMLTGVSLSSAGGFLQEGGAYYEEAVEGLEKARSRARSDAIKRDRGDISQEEVIREHGLTIDPIEGRNGSYDQLTDNEIEAIAISQSKDYAAWATAYEIGGTLLAQGSANVAIKGYGGVKTKWLKSAKGQRSVANSIGKRWYKSPYVKVPGQLAVEMASEGATEYLQEDMNMSMMEDMMPDYMKYTSMEKSDRLYESAVGGATGGLVFGGASMALDRVEKRYHDQRTEKEFQEQLAKGIQSSQEIQERIDKSSKPYADRNDQIVSIAMLADPTMGLLMDTAQELTDDDVDASHYYMARTIKHGWLNDKKGLIKLLNSYGAKKIIKELGLSAEDFYAVLGNKAAVQNVFGKKEGTKAKEFFGSDFKNMTDEDNTDYSGNQESESTNNQRVLGKAFEDLRVQHMAAQKKYRKSKSKSDKKEVDRLYAEMKKIKDNQKKRTDRTDIASKNTGKFVKDPSSPKIISINSETAHSQNRSYAGDDRVPVRMDVLGVRVVTNPLTKKKEKQYQVQLTQGSQLYIPSRKKFTVFESEIKSYYDSKGKVVGQPDIKEAVKDDGGLEIDTPAGIKSPKKKKATTEIDYGDETKNKIIASLRDNPNQTVQEIAESIEYPKEKIYYHIKKLQIANALEISETKKVKGITQNRFSVVPITVTGKTEFAKDVLKKSKVSLRHEGALAAYEEGLSQSEESFKELYNDIYQDELESGKKSKEEVEEMALGAHKRQQENLKRFRKDPLGTLKRDLKGWIAFEKKHKDDQSEKISEIKEAIAEIEGKPTKAKKEVSKPKGKKLKTEQDFDSLIAGDSETEDIDAADIATTSQNLDDELNTDDIPNEEDPKPFISWKQKGGLKGRDLRRVGAAFATAWQQVKAKYGVDNSFFPIWAEMTSRNLAESPIKGAFDTWAEEYSSDSTEFPVDPNQLLKDKLDVDDVDELEALPFTTDEVQNWIHASAYSSEFIRESIGADSLDTSVGNTSTSNEKAINNTFFAVAGITPTNSQQAAVYEILRKSPSFEEFVKDLSDEEFIKKNKFFLLSGLTMAQFVDSSETNRRIALRFWLNNNSTNKAKVNRGNKIGTIRSLVATWNSTKKVWKIAYKKAINKGYFKKNKNLQWGRTRMIEKWGLDPESYAYISFDDLFGWVKYENKDGEEKWMRQSFKGRKNLDHGQWLRLFKGIIDSGYVPVVVRGDGNMIFLAKITKEHHMDAANYQSYWKNEDISFDDHGKTIAMNYLPEFNSSEMVDFFAGGSHNKFMAANIARHEMYKRIYGEDYHIIDGATIQNRAKIPFSVALANPNMPSKKAMVFDSKVSEGENSSVVFRMENVDGTIEDKKLVKHIDNMWQYVLDGMTMVSERVLAIDYPKYLGTKSRAKRAKTVHYQRWGDGAMMNKHQEMSMWLPRHVKSAKIMDGDTVIAEFKRDEDGYLNIYDADGNYLDYLMSDDESKIRTGQYKEYNTPFDIMGEAIGLIQFPHEQEKQRAKFYPQLMNYFPEKKMQEAIMEMFDNPNEKRHHTAKSLFRTLVSISSDPKKLDAYLLSHSGRLLEEESLAYILAAQLGAGFHSSGMENARRILKNDILEGISSFYQFGSNLDFRMDPTGSVTDDEIILPSDHSIAKNITNRMKIGVHKENEDATTDEINDFLEKYPIEVLAVRGPVPSRFGYRILRVKMVDEGMGDTFVVSPRVVKEVFEGDGDGDKASIMFFEKKHNHISNMFKNRQPRKLGQNIGISLEADKREYNIGSIMDLVESMKAMQYGKTAISQIGSFAKIAGVVSTWFKSMEILDPDGNKIRITANSLEERIFDEGMGEEHSLANLVRRYMQAAVDHAKLLLLDKWGYDQDNLLNMLFKKEDGSELSVDEIKMIKQLILQPIKSAGNLHRGTLGGREIPFTEYFAISSAYEDYLDKRGNQVIEFEDGTSIHIKGKDGVTHYYDHLAMWFSRELNKYNLGTNFMVFSKQETQAAHMTAAEMLQDVMAERIIKTAMKQLGIKGKPTKSDMVKINRHLHQSTIAAQKLTNEISNLTKKKEREAKEEVADDPNEAENLFNINKWTYDKDARKIYEKWTKIYNAMSDAQRMAFTTAFLTVTASAEFGYRRKNPGMMPPASRGEDTVLGPNTVSLYYDYYNATLMDIVSILDADEVGQVQKMNDLFSDEWERMGCLS